MSTPSYRAIVLGASGAVGSALVRELLNSAACLEVVMLNRRHVDLWADSPHKAKLREHVIALENLEHDTLKYAEGCQRAFCTFGAGQPTKLSRKEFWKIDVEYPAAFALSCRKAGLEHISLLSSIGADLLSRSYYLRVKGEAEKAMCSAGFARTSLFRPSVLATSIPRYGLMERINQLVFPMISWILPTPLHEIHVDNLARAMCVNAERTADTAIEILRYEDFIKLARCG
ncbi:MAG: hypothetical protein NTX25_00570 [Proteobacteria bacterium]|nr:hypothetical protein [Pseudomonadota bacterium]